MLHWAALYGSQQCARMLLRPEEEMLFVQNTTDTTDKALHLEILKRMRSSPDAMSTQHGNATPLHLALVTRRSKHYVETDEEYQYRRISMYSLLVSEYETRRNRNHHKEIDRFVVKEVPSAIRPKNLNEW